MLCTESLYTGRFVTVYCLLSSTHIQLLPQLYCNPVKCDSLLPLYLTVYGTRTARGPCDARREARAEPRVSKS